jgi:hypothetical protein
MKYLFNLIPQWSHECFTSILRKEITMRTKQVTFGIGLFISLFAAVCVLKYIQNAPVVLTGEQEATICGGYEGTECLIAVGGCVPFGDEPPLIQCPDGVGPLQDCGQPRWSTDATRNRTCQSAYYWLYDTGCTPIANHDCVERYSACIPGSGTARHCSKRGEAAGAASATNCR